MTKEQLMDEMTAYGEFLWSALKGMTAEPVTIEVGVRRINDALSVNVQAMTDTERGERYIFRRSYFFYERSEKNAYRRNDPVYEFAGDTFYRGECDNAESLNEYLDKKWGEEHERAGANANDRENSAAS